jgi:hypothetical protein
MCGFNDAAYPLVVMSEVTSGDGVHKACHRAGSHGNFTRQVS